MRSVLHLVLIGWAAGGLGMGQTLAQETVKLWPDDAPGALGQEAHDVPGLRVYLPPTDHNTGCGVVICPGGGYGNLASDHEGVHVAKWLNSVGVAGFVLRYRHAPHYRHPTPLQDVQRAIRYVRGTADELRLSPRRIGVMGFSAGGHLASTAATHFDAGQPTAADPIDRVSCRPDFAILGYPVISLLAEYTHAGSRRNLLGDSPAADLLELLSNDRQVTAETPPTFIFHTAEDASVPVDHALAFYQALRKARVPAELHIYQFGPHGVGLAPGDPVASTWKDRLADWLRASALLADVQRVAVDGSVQVNGQDLVRGMITFIPADDPQRKPTAFGMISRGKFQIPESRGPGVGKYRVEVRDMGLAEPRPTLADVRRLDRDDLTVEIVATGAIHFTLNLE